MTGRPRSAPLATIAFHRGSHAVRILPLQAGPERNPALHSVLDECVALRTFLYRANALFQNRQGMIQLVPGDTKRRAQCEDVPFDRLEGKAPLEALVHDRLGLFLGAFLRPRVLTRSMPKCRPNPAT